MALAYNKFNDFVSQLGLLGHQLNTDAHKVALSNTGPVATNTVLANITEIASGNGYTTGGSGATNTYSASSGTGTLNASQIVWTGGAAAMATFRYAVYYSTATRNVTNPLVGWWDYGSGITLNPGETATWKPSSATSGAVFTIT
jgi:hypothetical protein